MLKKVDGGNHFIVVVATGASMRLGCRAVDAEGYQIDKPFHLTAFVGAEKGAI